MSLQLTIALRFDMKMGMAVWKDGNLLHCDRYVAQYGIWDTRRIQQISTVRSYVDLWREKTKHEFTHAAITAAPRELNRSGSLGFTKLRKQVHSMIDVLTRLNCACEDVTLDEKWLSRAEDLICKLGADPTIHTITAVSIGLQLGYCTNLDLTAKPDAALEKVRNAAPLGMLGLVDEVFKRAETLLEKFTNGGEVTSQELFQVRGILAFTELADLTDDTRGKIRQFSKQIAILNKDLMRDIQMRTNERVASRRHFDELERRIAEAEGKL